MQDLSLQHITNIVWTYATFLHDVRDMLPALISQLLERSQTEQFNAQQVSNLLWSFCILQVSPEIPLQPCCGFLCKACVLSAAVTCALLPAVICVLLPAMTCAVRVV